MRLLGSARYFRSHLSHKIYISIVSHHRLYRMSTSFMRTDVKEKEREREKERRKIRDGKNKSLFLRLLRLRKTEIITALSEPYFGFTIIAFRARRKRRKKNGTKSRTLLICFEAYARERVLYLISAQNTVLRNFVITSPPQNTSNRGRVIRICHHYHHRWERRVPKTTTNAPEYKTPNTTRKREELVNVSHVWSAFFDLKP